MANILKKPFVIALIIFSMAWVIPMGIANVIKYSINHSHQSIYVDKVTLSLSGLTINHAYYADAIEAENIYVHWQPWLFWDQNDWIRTVKIERLNIKQFIFPQTTSSTLNLNIPLIDIQDLEVNGFKVMDLKGHLKISENEKHILIASFDQQLQFELNEIKNKDKWLGQIALGYQKDQILVQYLKNHQDQWLSKNCYFNDKKIDNCFIKYNKGQYTINIHDKNMSVQGDGLLSNGSMKVRWFDTSVTWFHQPQGSQVRIQGNQIVGQFKIQDSITGQIQFNGLKLPNDYSVKGNVSLNEHHKDQWILHSDLLLNNSFQTVHSQIKCHLSDVIDGIIHLQFHDNDLKVQLKGPLLSPTVLCDLRLKKNQFKFLAEPLLKSGEYILKNQIQPGKNHWQLTESMPIILQSSGLKVGQQSFKNQDFGQLILFGSLDKNIKDSFFKVRLDSLNLLDLSDLTKDNTMIKALSLNGKMEYTWYSNPKKSSDLVIDFSDCQSTLTVFESDQLPFLFNIDVIGGKGKINYKDGRWIINGQLVTKDQGIIHLQSGKQSMLELENVTLGDQGSHHFLKVNGTVTINPSNEFRGSIDVVDGRLALSDYHPFVTNPLQQAHPKNAFQGVINVRFLNAIPIDILGLQGQVQGSLEVIKTKADWLGKGTIALKKGAVYQKLGKSITIKKASFTFYDSLLVDPFIQLIFERKEIILTSRHNLTSYEDEVLGMEISGRLSDYRYTLYSTPPGVPDVVIVQALMINPVLLDPNTKQSSSKNFFNVLLASVRSGASLPVDTVTFRPASPANDVIDPDLTSASVSVGKYINPSLSAHVRMGSSPRDNIFSLIYRWNRNNLSTQVYTNYQAAGINFVIDQ